jgi:hypothetical protein
MAGNGFSNVNIAPSTLARIKATATTNVTQVKTTAGTVTGFVLVNTTAAQKFVKLYDKATAPIFASDAPSVTLVLSANGQLVSDATWDFANGLAYAITNLIADNDATAVTADAVHGFIAHK